MLMVPEACYAYGMQCLGYRKYAYGTGGYAYGTSGGGGTRQDMCLRMILSCRDD